MQSTRPLVPILLCACALAGIPLHRAAAEDDSELEQLLDDKGDSEAAQTRMDVTLELMRHGHVRDRISAIWKGRIHTLEPEFYDRIVEQLDDKDPAIVSAAATALGEMGKKKAVEPLLKVLRESTGWVQESAAYALGMLATSGSHDKRAAADLERLIPKQPGLSQWIFQDALARVNGQDGAPDSHKHRLDGASIYYIGTAAENLRYQWREIIQRRNVTINAVAPLPLNTAMNKLSGPPNLTEFYSMLDDKDGKPQIDAVMISALLPYMFPLELRWKLVQFARRGGTLIVYGNSQFQTGEMPNSKGVVQFTYSMLPARFHGCLPQTLNDSFILFYANVRGYWRDHIRCGRRTWGHG
ncbi:MAG TPA: HEAT repeat domain-containing protein, partial [Planctomycetota bacterium]|nr:HEAT repeat domain-containing protein [Planctomycetota bacterium]